MTADEAVQLGRRVGVSLVTVGHRGSNVRRAQVFHLGGTYVVGLQFYQVQQRWQVAKWDPRVHNGTVSTVGLDQHFPAEDYNQAFTLYKLSGGGSG